MINASGKDIKLIRRTALNAQGLLQMQPFGRGLAGANRAINHIGYVQIDSISVVERAHHHVLHSRVPGFKPGMTDQLLQERQIFEYWSHAAAFLPIADFRFSLPYKEAIKNGQTHWNRNPDRTLMAELLQRIQGEGPLRSRDLDVKNQKRAGWWDWKPTKKALEQLYMEGDLMVSGREGFQKTYDLTERVLSSDVDTRMPSLEEFSTHMLDQQLRCQGVVSLKGLTYQRRNAGLRQAMKNLVSDRVAQGELEQVRLPGGEVYIVEKGALDQPLPRFNKRLLILSPFDNSLIQRDRLKALFQYNYQIECYLPAGKRRFGYFCLPLLFGDEFVGRMDCKVHRKTRHFEIKSLYFEAHQFDDEMVMTAFADALKAFCDFQDCDNISLRAIHPKQLNALLRNKIELKMPLLY